MQGRHTHRPEKQKSQRVKSSSSLSIIFRADYMEEVQKLCAYFILLVIHVRLKIKCVQSRPCVCVHSRLWKDGLLAWVTWEWNNLFYSFLLFPLLLISPNVFSILIIIPLWWYYIPSANLTPKQFRCVSCRLTRRLSHSHWKTKKRLFWLCAQCVDIINWYYA